MQSLEGDRPAELNVDHFKGGVTLVRNDQGEVLLPPEGKPKELLSSIERTIDWVYKEFTNDEGMVTSAYGSRPIFEVYEGIPLHHNYYRTEAPRLPIDNSTP